MSPSSRRIAAFRLVADRLWRTRQDSLGASQWYLLLLCLACTAGSLPLVLQIQRPAASLAATTALLALATLRLVENRRGRLLVGWSDLVETGLFAGLLLTGGLGAARLVALAVLAHRAFAGDAIRLAGLQTGYVSVLVAGGLFGVLPTFGAFGAAGLALLLPLVVYLLRDLIRTTRSEVGRERRLLQSILHHLNPAILVTDRDGALTFVNDTAQTMLALPADRDGRPEGPLSAQLISAAGDDLLATGTPIAEALAEYAVQSEELLVVRAERDQSRMSVAVEPLLDDDEETAIGVVLTLHDVTQQRDTESRLTQLALHDHLTGLANRALLRARVDKALRDAEVGATALLLIDLDAFKSINDTMGHDVGDEVIKAAGARLARSVRPNDTVARLGGDEFGVLLADTDHDGAMVVAERVVSRLNEPLVLAGRPLQSGASVGVAISRAETATPDDLIRDADLAMYRAKEAGGGRASVYADDLHRQFMVRVQLENDVRSAVTRKQLKLHYQPIVDVSSEVPTAVEALLRWQHPRRGEVSPAEFIPLAERLGLIDDIGAWALTTACREIAEHNRSTSQLHLDVSVNVSPQQLEDSRFGGIVERALEDAGLSATRLILEITESGFVGSPRAIAVLSQLRVLGVRIAIDDFGTGYSSLSRLHALPADILKIDRSLVGQIRPHADAPVLRTAVALGSGLGLRVVAEGVETTQQLQFLREHECDSAQGFLFSHPVPWSELGYSETKGIDAVTTLSADGKPRRGDRFGMARRPGAA